MKRIEGVDFFRTLAVFAVILIHIRPFASSEVAVGGSMTLASTVNLLSRFAVPFFFVVSGYFWGKRIGNASDAWSASVPTLKRLAMLFLWWNLIYMFPLDFELITRHGALLLVKAPYWHAIAFLADPLNWIFHGTGFHLWFITSLMCCVAVTAKFIELDRPRSLMLVAVALFILAVLTKAYVATPLGIHTSFNMRNGPFFGLIFFASGFFLSRSHPKPEWFTYGLLALTAGSIISYGEVHYLNGSFGTSTVQDFVFGTYLQGLGASLMALSNAKYVSNNSIAAIGPLAFGIYAVHVLFIEGLQKFDVLHRSPIGDLAFALAVLASSWLVAWIMSRFEVTRSLVV